MNRSQFLKSLGAIAGLAVAAPILEVLPVEETAELTPELMEEIVQLLKDALRRDIERRWWFGDPESLGFKEGQKIYGGIITKYEPFQDEGQG